LIDRYRMPAEQFDALAAGHGDAATVELLWSALLSKTVLRLRALLDSSASFDRASFDLLADVQREAPGIVAKVLRYPHVAAWSARCLRRLQDADHGLVLAHLGGVVAAAAIAAGSEITATVPVRDGRVALPLLGCAEVGPETVDGTAQVRSRPPGAEISTPYGTVVVPADPRTDAPGWQGLRQLSSTHDGVRLEVHLDDLDPFRDNHRLVPASRLDTPAIEAWQRTLDGAWAILVRHHPERAEAIAAGLAALVPLRTDGERRALSATSADAPGAMALTPTHDPLLLAESLVHEFQHAKLCALLELIPLCEADGEERFYAPWRDDPRPFGGLLQGAYAYLGVTDFWGRQQAVTTGADAAFAQYAVVLWRDQTLRAVRRMERSGLLTGTGARFVAGMRADLTRWVGLEVPSVPRALAEDTAAEHALTWRLRHLRPDDDMVERIARSWPEGSPSALARPATVTASEQGAERRGTREELRHLRLHRPEEFRRLAVDPVALRAIIPDADECDLAQVSGDHETATRCYTVRLSAGSRARSQAVADWSGLAVSARRLGTGAAAEVLAALPEVVAAVHGRIVRLGDDVPHPLELACWLEPMLNGTPEAWTALPDLSPL
jgi:HEXXH motif-containing protein